MRRHWRLSHRPRGVSETEWAVHLSEAPAWTYALETVWNGLCVLTRGWAGGHGQAKMYNAVVWRLPVGHPKWDRSEPGQPYLKNSLGSALYRLENWALTRSDERGREVAEVFITEDVARVIDEDFVEDMLDLDDEVRRVER